MLSAVLARYGAFFALPDVVRMVAMALVARMPLGTQGLALLLHIRALTGSFATAGATVGTYLAASAVCSPIIGRVVDRAGPRVPLLVTGVVCPLALVALLFAQPLHLTQGAILAASGIAGAFAPPITVLTRTMWRYRFERDMDARRTAFAIDAVLVEIAFTIGPALVALLVAIASPAVAYGAAVFFAAIAAPVFLASPALRYWHRAVDVERHLLGPLTETRLLLVYATTALLTFCLGLIEVAYPGFATASGSPALSGVLLAICSIGSALGGLAYGGLHVHMPVEHQLRRLLVTLAVALGVQVWVDSVVLLAVLGFIAGLFIAPALTAVSLLVSANTPARYATEAFTWSATCIVTGVGVGTAVGGILVERYDAHAVLALSAAGALAAALVALALRGQPRDAIA